MNTAKRVIGFFILSQGLYASSIDVYGVSPELTKSIINTYGDAIQRVEKARVENAMKQLPTSDLEVRSTHLKEEIQKKFGFKNLNIETVYYPENKKIYTTISICANTFKYEYRYQTYPVRPKQDIIDKMHFFIPKAIHFYVTHPEYVLKMNCRDYHCIVPEHPDLNDQLKYFRQEVTKHETLIEQTLFKDKNLERRRAAIFLLGYYSSPNKINQLLIPLLDDSNPYIRHDALRVYGELYAKSPHLNVPIEKVVHSLYSCDTAERNKALILLNELSKNKKYQQALILKAGKPLIELLRLEQPNNHLLAYRILKTISHQSLPDTNFIKWEEWIISHT